jgi:hypothetical protein
MKIAFILTMPNRGSWNGRWSGEKNLYCVVRNFSDGKKAREKTDKILASKSYYYSWSDGWGASVEVKQVTGQESRQYKKQSKGFCGYDWMIDSIICHGEIYASHEEIPVLTKPASPPSSGQEATSTGREKKGEVFV